LHRGEKIIREFKPVPDDMSQYFLSRFYLDIDRLKEAVNDRQMKQYKKLHRTADKTGRQAIRFAKKAVADLPEAERLMGMNYWIQGKQKKALKCWARSIEQAEKRGARLELSRTYFEVGKSLQAKGSRYKELNGMNAQDYLDKAQRLFCELDLSWDLSELEKAIKNHKLKVGEVVE
jgi:tetratricopeptide (TPR) repeat protein